MLLVWHEGEGGTWKMEMRGGRSGVTIFLTFSNIFYIVLFWYVGWLMPLFRNSYFSWSVGGGIMKYSGRWVPGRCGNWAPCRRVDGTAGARHRTS